MNTKSYARGLAEAIALAHSSRWQAQSRLNDAKAKANGTKIL